MRTERPALSGPLQVASHAFLVVFGWVLFGAFWWVVLPQSPDAFINIAWLIAAALFLLPVITLYWVMHNRGIYARKGPRQHVQLVATSYAHDWAGRPVRADFDALRQAQEITILCAAEEKHFMVVCAAQPYPEAA